jgi:hypothetical protein
VRYLGAYFLGERLGSGDGEEWTLQTRQKAFEPLPIFVLFRLMWPVVCCAVVMPEFV